MHHAPRPCQAHKMTKRPRGVQRIRELGTADCVCSVQRAGAPPPQARFSAPPDSAPSSGEPPETLAKIWIEKLAFSTRVDWLDPRVSLAGPGALYVALSLHHTTLHCTGCRLITERAHRPGPL